jgi:signal transduction histidine kinase
VLDGSPVLRGRPLLTAPERLLAARGELLLERARVDWTDERIRLLAEPVEDPSGRTLLVVAGSSTEAKGDALESLLQQLLLLGPVAVLLSAVAGYLLAAAALRPVEAMRREAEAVSAVEPGRRLPLPAADDELARLAETLNAMLGGLEAALERERRFVADAGHELRTPIAALRTELELALRHERSAEELREAVRSAAEEADRLGALADELLVLARSSAGVTVRRRVEISALLDGARQRHEARFAAAGREVRVVGGVPLGVEGDPDQLARALDNLVANALVHGSGDVWLEALARGSWVELHVRDEGPGFGPELVDRAFEPFARADAARSTGGAGLGLAIVAAIAQAHGGTAAIAGPHVPDVWLSLPLAA